MEAVKFAIQLARRLADDAQGLTLEDIASEFEVSRRTAERWRDVVLELFPYLEALPDGKKMRYRIPGGMDRLLLQLSAEELAELKQAADRLSKEGAVGRAAHLDSLHRKVRASLRHQVKVRLDPDVEALLAAETLAVAPGPRARYSPDHMEAIRQAIKMGRTVTIVYARNGQVEERQIDPYGLLFGRSYFLVGPMVGKADPVHWRLDRIESIHLNERVSARPADFDLQAFALRSVGVFQEPPELISLLFSAEVGNDVHRIAFHPEQKMERLDDGSVRVSFTAGGFRELAWHLVTWGRAVTVESPAVLDDLLDEIVWETMSRPRVPERAQDITVEVIKSEWSGNPDDNRRVDEVAPILPTP